MKVNQWYNTLKYEISASESTFAIKFTTEKPISVKNCIRNNSQGNFKRLKKWIYIKYLKDSMLNKKNIGMFISELMELAIKENVSLYRISSL